MGQIKFRVPDHRRFDVAALDTIFMLGLDQVTWPCSVSRDGELLTVTRNCQDSGRLLLSLRFPQFGELVVGTATLPERNEPYNLPLELLRGTLNRLNNQLFLWKEGGLEVCEELSDRNHALNGRMADLVFRQEEDEFVADAFCLLDDVMEFIHELAKKFADFVLNLRVQHDGHVKSAIGFVLSGKEDEQPDNLPEWINCVSLPLNRVEWNYESREFNWDEAASISQKYEGRTRLMAFGPMLDFSRKHLPAWLSNDDSFDLQRQTAANFARGYARNLGKQNQLAFVTAGINGITPRSRNYPQQMQLAVDMLEAIENVRSDLNTMVSFDQPWGERLAWSVGGVHSMHIADTLLRHGLHISCFGLELNLDYWPHGSLFRDPLHWVDLIDYWSQFGIPLFIILSAPIPGNSDSAQKSNKKTTFENSDETKRLSGYRGFRDGMTRQQLYDHLESVIRVLLAKPIVNGIIWRQWQDESGLRFPMSGLMCESGEPKLIQPLLDQIGKLVHGKVE